MSSSPSIYNSFLAGTKDELAIMFDNHGAQLIYSLKKPSITDVTISHRPGYSKYYTAAGETKHYNEKGVLELDITLKVTDDQVEIIKGEDIGDELPELAENLSVEELIHLVNEKIEERRQ